MPCHPLLLQQLPLVVVVGLVGRALLLFSPFLFFFSCSGFPLLCVCCVRMFFPFPYIDEATLLELRQRCAKLLVIPPAKSKEAAVPEKESESHACMWTPPAAFRMLAALLGGNGQSAGTTASKAMLRPVAVFGVFPFLSFPFLANISCPANFGVGLIYLSVCLSMLRMQSICSSAT
jgi:hypothetical protein